SDRPAFISGSAKSQGSTGETAKGTAGDNQLQSIAKQVSASLRPTDVAPKNVASLLNNLKNSSGIKAGGIFKDNGNSGSFNPISLNNQTHHLSLPKH
ncbi:hypothetical protein JDN41_11420, partial [Rhodomicrobium udaipurense]|nr:hypothetical protein [Rhodomicrobium udaipurense]